MCSSRQFTIRLMALVVIRMLSSIMVAPSNHTNRLNAWHKSMLTPCVKTTRSYWRTRHPIRLWCHPSAISQSPGTRTRWSITSSTGPNKIQRLSQLPSSRAISRVTTPPWKRQTRCAVLATCHHPRSIRCLGRRKTSGPMTASMVRTSGTRSPTKRSRRSNH